MSFHRFESRYTPAFEYEAEQCVSAVITTYTPVLVLSSTITGLLLPSIYLLLPLLRVAPPPPSHWLALVFDVPALWGEPDHTKYPMPLLALLFDEGLATERLFEAAFTTMFVMLSLVMTVGIASPSVAAAALLATAGGLASAISMLGMRHGTDFANCDKEALEALAERTPWGGIMAAMLPLPAARAFLWNDYFSFGGRSRIDVVVLLSLFFCGLAACRLTPAALLLWRRWCHGTSSGTRGTPTVEQVGDRREGGIAAV